MSQARHFFIIAPVAVAIAYRVQGQLKSRASARTPLVLMYAIAYLKCCIGYHQGQSIR